jgi:soluble lytic murein transglycosylase
MKKLLFIMLFFVGMCFAENNTEIFHINKGADIVQQINKKIDEITAIKISTVIWQESSNQNIDFYFVLGIIGAESRFNQKAESYCGAVGIMQLMPKTAAYIAKKYEIIYKDLWDLETNVKIGIKYLCHLKKKYNNSYELAAAGYNGGNSAARKYKEWMSGTRDKTAVPNETFKYVPKVMNYTKEFRLWKI